MGIDYGDSRIGFAISDPFCITAQGLHTMENRGEKKNKAAISELLNKHKPDKIVLGLPKNMDGSEGFRVDETHKFRDLLSEIYDGEIILWDERLTTVMAHNILNMTNTRGAKRKKVIDTVSASIILESYLNATASERNI